MNIFINILVGFICLIIGYIFGSIPFAIIYGKVKYHEDIRNYGSGNAGATNVKRTWGRKAGVLVTILDGLKTFLPLMICWAILTFVPFGDRPLLATTEIYWTNPEANDYIIRFPIYWISVIGVVIGHCWPLFAQFKGGKGAASLICIACCTSWLIGFIPLLCYIPLKIKSKMVSFTVLIGNAIMLTVAWIYSALFMMHVIPADLYWLPGYGPFLNIPFWFPLTLTLVYILVAIRHKENIKRLIAGTERRTQKYQLVNNQQFASKYTL